MPSNPPAAACACGPREVVDDLADLVRLERLGRLVVVRHVRRRPHRQLRPRAVVHAAVVGELEEGERAVLVHRRGDPLEVRHRCRIPRDGVVAHLVRGGRVHLGLARDDHARRRRAPARRGSGRSARRRSRARPTVPLGLGEQREVRAEHDAVRRRHRPDPQGREQPGPALDHCAIRSRHRPQCRQLLPAGRSLIRRYPLEHHELLELSAGTGGLNR